MAKAALYLRKSTNLQADSIPQQRAEVAKYAAVHGYTIIREYIDEGISGDHTEKRLAFQRMRDDVDRGEFEVVLAWDQDRFGRFDPIEAGWWIKPFRDRGVRLETVAQGRIDWNDFAGRISYIVAQEAKHAFLKDQSRNICRGQLAAARRGERLGGPAPFGYVNVGKTIAIDEPKAEIVRRIFRQYINGGSLRMLADQFNCEKIPSPADGDWTVTTVRRILTNRKYTGDYVHNEELRGRYHRKIGGNVVPSQKTTKRQKAKPEDVIVVPDNHPAIVDREQFAAVQSKLVERKRMTTPIRGGGGFTLSGLLVCGHCGRRMSGCKSSSKWQGKKYEYRRYRCAGAQQGGKSACRAYSVLEAPITDCIVGKIQEALLSPESIAAIRAEVERQLKAERRPGVDVAQLQSKLAAIDVKIKQATDKLIVVENDMVELVASRIRELRAEQDALREAIEQQQQAGDDEPDEIDADAAIAELWSLQERMGDAAELRQVLHEIIIRVEVWFESDRSKKRERLPISRGLIHVRPDLGFVKLVPAACPAVTSLTILFSGDDVKAAG